MNIDSQLMAQIARLAKLHLVDQEVRPLQQDLQQILGYVATLQSLDLSACEAQAQASKGCTQRTDEIRETDTESALNGFPERSNRLLVVPRVVDDT